jgi:hypothetical protein
LATTNNPELNKPQSDMICPGSNFDLGTLVEQVATVLCAGQTHQPVALFTDRPSSTTAVGNDTDDQHFISGDDVSVVVRIEQPDSWKLRSASGPWRRILMNVIGNAMKWTKNGLIEVKLSKTTQGPERGSSFAHLRVSDTGSGISREYLRNMLFSPFAQEDPLSPGVGLGLSIVRKLVMSLDGDIDVRSELGAGTQVDIYVPVSSLATTLAIPTAGGSIPETPNSPSPIHALVLGLQDEPKLNEIPTGILTVDAKRKASIQTALMDVLKTQLGWDLSFAKFPAEEHTDVAIIEEADLHHMLIESLSVAKDFKPVHKYIIVLGQRKASLTGDLPANIIYVSQP